MMVRRATNLGEDISGVTDAPGFWIPFFTCVCVDANSTLKKKLDGLQLSSRKCCIKHVIPEIFIVKFRQ